MNDDESQQRWRREKWARINFYAAAACNLCSGFMSTLFTLTFWTATVRQQPSKGSVTQHKKSLSVTKFTLRCVSLKSAPVHPNGGNHVSAAGMWVEGDQWRRIRLAVALLSLLSGRRWRQGWARCKSKGFQFNPEETGSDAISPGYKWPSIPEQWVIMELWEALIDWLMDELREDERFLLTEQKIVTLFYKKDKPRLACTSFLTYNREGD